MSAHPIIAIVGRPNVGKSTLFNRLIHKRKAIVYDQPGVTRDRHYATTDWQNIPFTLVDTGGYEIEPESTLFEQMGKQIEVALLEAKVILWVVDGRAGLTAEDQEIGKKIRKLGKPLFLVINKIDAPKQELDLAEFYRLGIERFFTVSAEHGRAIGDLLDAVIEVLEVPRVLPIKPTRIEKNIIENDETSEGSQPYVPSLIRVAILGRPNVGKSTLLNHLFGAPRAVVHDEPGTTRDPLDVEIEIDGTRYQIIDTAGIRRKANAESKIEKVSVLKSLESVEKSDLTVLLLDASEGLTSQDGSVAQHVLDRKRPLILLLNKWDRVPFDFRWKEALLRLKKKFHTLKFVPALPISAKTGFGVERIFREIKRVFQENRKRLKTSQVNEVFQSLVEANPPPTVSGKSLNLFYMTQIGTRPPNFLVFTNHPELIPESYQRYLMNGLRKSFSFRGVPIVLRFQRRKKRPFVK